MASGQSGPEPSVLGTFVLDSPSKVLFSSFLGAWGFSGCGVGSGDGPDAPTTFRTLPPKFFPFGQGGAQRASAAGASGPERSVLGTFVLDSPSKVLFSSFWGP